MTDLPPPAPPQVTPDGKFYWDGNRWVPLQKSQGTPAAPASNSEWGKIAVAAVIALIVGGAVGFAIGSASHATSPTRTALGGGASPPADSPAPDSPSTAPEAPTTLSAKGATNTRKFTLAGGDYTVTYNFSGSCFYGANLQQTASGGTDLASATGPIKGTNNVYGIAAGSYYIYMISGPAPDCPWTLTLTRN